ncbi:MAG: hypothetical protein DMD81_22410 [Candidatus Rokuibacteriota bacterium]|nr:MAG: hypothetical protein DMD81_22410 [Candidatus Rokubacteria bacterium]
MPFVNRHHGGDEPFDLSARIDAELRSRIEDAVDFVCLDAMVHAREATGARPPAADDPRDREEYLARVVAFLELLRVELAGQLTPEQRRRLGNALSTDARNVDAALRAQVALAKELPDYWQRFDAIRKRPGDAAPSGGESRRLLDWLLGRR